MAELFIPVVLGTTREGRETEKVARYVLDQLEKRNGVTTVLIDPRSFNFSLNEDGRRHFPPWQEVVEKADGFIIVSPEYNHGYPATLKFLLDQVRPVFYLHRAVGIVSTGGPMGGGRMIESLLPVLRELGLVVIKKDLRFHEVANSFGPGDTPLEGSIPGKTETFLDELTWMAQALQVARTNI